MNGRLHLTGFHQNSPTSFLTYQVWKNRFAKSVNIPPHSCNSLISLPRPLNPLLYHTLILYTSKDIKTTVWGMGEIFPTPGDGSCCRTRDSSTNVQHFKNISVFHKKKFGKVLWNGLYTFIHFFFYKSPKNLLKKSRGAGKMLILNRRIINAVLRILILIYRILYQKKTTSQNL